MSELDIAGYEIWDTESRNLLDDFDTEAEAIEAVRELIAVNGAACTAALALTRVTVDGSMQTLAIGTELALRAERSGQGRARRPA